MNEEYQKIEAVFNRESSKPHKTILFDWRNPIVAYLKDVTWIATEKIDGTNIRVYWDGHSVSFAGRTDRAQIPSHLLEKLNSLFGGDEMEQVFEQTFGSKEVILYGEGYGPKIQKNGELYGDDVSFILFDVKINGTYLDFANVIDIGESLGIDVVPILMEDDLISIIDFVAEGHKSTIGNNDMEGVVARPKYPLYDRRGNRIIVKVKYNDVKDCK